MENYQTTTSNDSEQPEVISDSEYIETLKDKIEGLATAFNRLKNAIVRKDSEND